MIFVEREPSAYIYSEQVERAARGGKENRKGGTCSEKGRRMVLQEKFLVLAQFRSQIALNHSAVKVKKSNTFYENPETSETPKNPETSETPKKPEISDTKKTQRIANISKYVHCLFTIRRMSMITLSQSLRFHQTKQQNLTQKLVQTLTPNHHQGSQICGLM
eukprot:TRINITY_DN501_c0_g1_i4.p1 TRINITY_DN501_c0_g1~~TRINITY_DN501_c0_g1_i4.p1  ORF type:complete len:162 (+),score=21.96 TRINITY_DN501_c0_g1_i4:407-892(+)